MHRQAMLSCTAVLLALVAVACGGGSSPSSPSSPSAAQAVTVQGVVLGGSAAAPLTAQSVQPLANAGSGTVTVTVAGTSQTTTVSANGTFELQVGAGTFTLIFQSNNVEIGRVEITAQAGAQVKIVVQVQSNSLNVVDIKVESGTETSNDGNPTCTIDGGKAGQGIELEGAAASALDTADHFMMTINGQRASTTADVSASGASFKCNGKKGKSTQECKTFLVAGARVHVRGTLMSCTTTPAPVTANEVMLQ